MRAHTLLLRRYRREKHFTLMLIPMRRRRWISSGRDEEQRAADVAGYRRSDDID